MMTSRPQEVYWKSLFQVLQTRSLHPTGVAPTTEVYILSKFTPIKYNYYLFPTPPFIYQDEAIYPWVGPFIKLGGNKKCGSSSPDLDVTFPCYLNLKLLFSFLPFQLQACLTILFLSFCLTAFSAPSVFKSCSPAGGFLFPPSCCWVRAMRL